MAPDADEWDGTTPPVDQSAVNANNALVAGFWAFVLLVLGFTIWGVWHWLKHKAG